MVNRVDGAILGVGALVLLASVLGVIFYEDDSATYTVSWAEDDGTELPAATQDGGPEEYTFDVPVNGTAIARASFMVEVSAGGVQLSDDSVSVSVSGPGGQSGDCSFTLAAGQGSSASCTANATVIEQPEGFTVNAANQTAAEDKALAQIASTNGTGTWTVTVTINGGQELQDPTYTVNLQPIVYEWDPTAQVPTAGSGSGPG